MLSFKELLAWCSYCCRRRPASRDVVDRTMLIGEFNGSASGPDSTAGTDADEDVHAGEDSDAAGAAGAAGVAPSAAGGRAQQVFAARPSVPPAVRPSAPPAAPASAPPAARRSAPPPARPSAPLAAPASAAPAAPAVKRKHHNQPLTLNVFATYKMGHHPNKGKEETIFPGPRELKGYELGHGGMGTVYKVFLDGEWIAIKVCRPKAIQKCEREGERPPSAPLCDHHHLKSEYQYLQPLSHPNIAGVLGVEEREQEAGSSNTVYFLKFKLAAGCLDSYLKTVEAHGHRLCYIDVLRIMRDVLRALAWLREVHQLVHSDIKPANVLIYLDEQGRIQVRLGDFGVAKKEGSRTLGLHGTAEYAGPEMARIYQTEEGWQYTKLTCAYDIFSLAVTIYELLSGALEQNLLYVHVPGLRKAKTHEEQFRCLMAWYSSPDWIFDVSRVEYALDGCYSPELVTFFHVLRSMITRVPAVRPLPAQLLDRVDDMIFAAMKRREARCDNNDAAKKEYAHVEALELDWLESAFTSSELPTSALGNDSEGEPEGGLEGEPEDNPEGQLEGDLKDNPAYFELAYAHVPLPRARPLQLSRQVERSTIPADVPVAAVADAPAATAPAMIAAAADVPAAVAGNCR